MDNKNNQQKQEENKEYKQTAVEIAIQSAKRAGNERARREIIRDYESGKWR